MPIYDHYQKNRQSAIETLRKFKRLVEARPRILYEFFIRVLTPSEIRRIVRLDHGILLYINPLNHLGHYALDPAGYEPETFDVLARYIKPGQIACDVGANEGIFTAYMGKLVGPEGKVLAIEPQSRLRDILEINCRLNGLWNCWFFQNALGRPQDQTGRLALYSGLNSGSSSLVKRYYSTVGYEDVQFVTVDTILETCGSDIIHFMKVDTEGFEAEITEAIEPHLARGKVKLLFLDFHDDILASRGMSRSAIHKRVIDSGMRMREGMPDKKNSYILYEWP